MVIQRNPNLNKQQKIQKNSHKFAQENIIVKSITTHSDNAFHKTSNVKHRVFPMECHKLFLITFKFPSHGLFAMDVKKYIAIIEIVNKKLTIDGLKYTLRNHSSFKKHNIELAINKINIKNQE